MPLNMLNALTAKGKPLEIWLEFITILLHFHLPRNLPKYLEIHMGFFKVLLYLKDQSVSKWIHVQFAFE